MIASKNNNVFIPSILASTAFYLEATPPVAAPALPPAAGLPDFFSALSLVTKLLEFYFINWEIYSQ